MTLEDEQGHLAKPKKVPAHENLNEEAAVLLLAALVILKGAAAKWDADIGKACGSVLQQPPL